MAIYHLLGEQEIFSEKDGGAISRWAANALRDGTEIVVCPSFDGSWGFPQDRIYKLPKWELTDPIHPILYRLPWTLQKAAYLKVFEGLLEKLQRGDILYIHNRPECASVLATVADQRGFKIVLHMHNSHLIRANKGQLNALKSTPIVFCSDFLRKEVHAALPGHFEKTYLVYNGADDKKFYSAERTNNSVPTVIWTGRIVPYKGVHILLEAMRILQAKGIEIAGKIVGGSGFGRSRPTRYVRQLQKTCPSNTKFVGYAAGNDLANQLRSSDIFCCPSIWNDPFPLAPIEAMATGLPVIATSRGGLRELLAEGGGILIPENDPQKLADALQTLVEDRDYRQRLGRAARSSFEERFLWSNVRHQYEQVLCGLAA